MEVIIIKFLDKLLNKKGKKNDCEPVFITNKIPPTFSANDIHYADMTTKIVGVTFESTNGTSRQSILKNILSEKTPVNVSLKEYTYEGSPAIMVLYKGIDIGNISKRQITRIKKSMPLIDKLELRVYKGDKNTYGARLLLYLKE